MKYQFLYEEMGLRVYSTFAFNGDQIEVIDPKEGEARFSMGFKRDSLFVYAWVDILPGRKEDPLLVSEALAHAVMQTVHSVQEVF